MYAGAIVDTVRQSSGFTPLMFCCQNGHAESAFALIKARRGQARGYVGSGCVVGDVQRACGLMILHLNEDRACSPRQAKASLDMCNTKNGEAALHIAARGGQASIVRALVLAGAKVTLRSDEAR